MIEPPLSSLLEKVDSRYTLCIMVGKRARKLTEGSQPLTRCNSRKTVTIATYEINENMVTYVRTKNGIK